MKKFLLICAVLSVAPVALAAHVGSLYSSNTTDVKIAKQGNQYHVSASLGISGCGGEYAGKGQLVGNTLTVFDAATARENGGDASEYMMKIRFSSDFKKAKIIHVPGMHYSGAACSFNDGGNPNLKRVR